MKTTRLASFALAGLLALPLLACTATAEDDAGASEQAHSGTPGSHVGGHGMILFGTEKIFVSHLPTYGAPHNIQVVAEVAIESGVPESAQAFSDTGYSIRPGGAFSLFDFAHGSLSSFTGTIFRGNFESGGRPLYANVKFKVVNVTYHEGLSPQTPVAPSLDYIAVGTPTDAYLVHVLDAPSTFDQIVGVAGDTDLGLSAEALAAGTKVTVVDGVNAVRERPRAGADVVVTYDPPKSPVTEPEPTDPNAPDTSVKTRTLTLDRNVDAGEGEGEGEPTDDGGKTAKPKVPNVSVKLGVEYSCLLGNDFFRRCP